MDADGSAAFTGPQGGCAGHYYNEFPVGVPALGVPFVLGLRAATPLLRSIVPAGTARSHPELAALLAGDLIQAHAVVEEWIASWFVALAAVAMYGIARRYLSVGWSVLLAFTLAFATSAWSSGSRAFGMHAPSMFLIALIIYLLLCARDRPALAAYAGLAVAAAYALRPTNSLAVIWVSAYVFERHRRWFVRYLLWALPVAIPFVVYNLSVYHSLFSPYYVMGPWAGHAPDPGGTAIALAGQMLSPSRGLLVFTPVLVFSVWGMWRAWRQRFEWPLSRYLSIWVVVHWVLISLYVDFWWAGHSYGPRWFTDLAPVFVFFLIPAIEGWRTATRGVQRATAAAFLCLLGASVFCHARGAFSLDAQNWSAVPNDIDRYPARLWDWRDPQFLRGLHGGVNTEGLTVPVNH